jgi:hypothetical protein
MHRNNWRKWLNQFFNPRRRVPVRRRPVVPHLDLLEDRWMPTIVATGQNISFIEGNTNSVLAATFTDTTPSAAADYSASIRWGDGTTTAGTVSLGGGTYFVTGSHAYVEETASVAVTVVIQENVGDLDSGTANSTATVADAALSPVPLTFTPVETLAFSGTVASFTDSNPGGTVGDFTASIDWGDGTTTAGTVTQPGGVGTPFTVSGTHTYAEDGSTAVHVTVTDVGGASTVVNSTANVQEGSFVLSGVAPISANEGTAFSGTLATFTDPGSPDPANSFTATIDWGDGTTTAGTVTGGGGNFTITGTHTYADEFSGNINVTVQEGTFFTIGPNPDSVTVVEADVLTPPPPTSGSGTEGSPFPIFVPFTDFNTSAQASDFTATIDWGDGTTAAGTVTSPSPGILDVTGSHIYTDEGAFTIRVTLADDPPGTAMATWVSDIGGATITEGDSLAGTGLTVTPIEQTSFNGNLATFTDTNSHAQAADFAATIDWGDGITTAGTVSGSAGGPFTVSGTHTYAEDGTYHPVVTILDDAPGTATATATATANVLEGSFTIVGVLPLTATEGTAFSGTLATFTDPGSPDPASSFTATIDWGDGTTTAGTVTGGGGNFTVTGTHTYADEFSGNINVTVQEDTLFTSAPTPDVVNVIEADTLTPQAITTGNIFENEFVGGTAATWSDAGYPSNNPADFSASFDWGDGTTYTTADGNVIVTGDGAGHFTLSVAGHTYLDEGVYTVHATLTDNAPGTATSTQTGFLTVGEADTLVPTAVQPNATLTEGNGGTSRAVAVFSDAGYPNNVASDFTATIDWGDGTTSAGTVSTSGDGNFTVSGSHAYADEGTFTATTVLRDDAPGTATATATSVVNAIEGDTLSASATPVSAAEGQSFSNVKVATFTSTYVGNVAGDFSAVILWGDGTSSAGVVTGSGGNFTVTGDHVYLDEGLFTTTVTVRDNAPGTAAASAVGAATVAENDTLSGSLLAIAPTEGTTFSGTVATFTNTTYPSNPATDFTATINWGDGTTTAGTVLGAGASSFSVTGNHTYADEGPFTVTVLLIDDAPGTAVGTATGTVTVAEGDTLTATATPVGATEGTAFSGAVATFSDTNAANTAADFTASINWGDGTTTTGTVTGGGGKFTVSGSHTYADEGDFTVTAVLTDDAPGTASSTATGAATVAEGDTLTGTLTAAGATEGTAFSGTVATFTDAYAGNVAADFTATINWGDGTTTTGTVTGGSGTFTVSGSHTYADEGPFTVTAVLTDNAPGTATGTASGTLTVAEGDTLSATATPVGATEGTAFSGAVATFKDTNSANTAADFTATIEWGDGTSTTGTVTGGSGTFTVSGSHTYADEGPFTITAVLTDDAPGTASATATGTATVAEADSLDGTTTPIQTVEGTPVGVTATFTNTFTSNPASDFTATINWGDGTTTAGTVTGGNGSFTVTGSHTYTASGSFTAAVTLTDDAPGTASKTVTTTASVSGNVVVQGTSGGNVLTVFRTPGGGVGSITYVLNNNPPVTLTGVNSFSFNGQSGNDILNVNFGNSGPLVSGPVSFDGGAGHDTLVVDAAGRALCTPPGQIRVNETQVITYTNVESTNINNAAAVDAFAGPDTADRSTAFTGLNAQEHFVQALYLDELGRPGSKAELDAWVPELSAPGGATIVATAIQHSPEARDYLVKSWYIAFLGRTAAGGEELPWVSLLLQGQTEEQVLSQFLATPEFFTHAQTLVSSGTANERYVQSLYLVLLNRTGSASEIAAWVNEVALVGRQMVAQSILTSTEFRTDQFEGYYNALLHRPSNPDNMDPSSLNIWVFSGMGIGGVRIGFETSSEFFVNG